MKSVNIPPGKYRHFKGQHYKIIGVAENVDSGELFVIYQPLYGEYGLTARPLDNFIEKVIVNGLEVPRFERVDEGQCQCQNACFCISEMSAI